MDRLFGAGGAGGGGGPQQWFLSLPPVTRLWLGATLVITGVANVEFAPWHQWDFARWEDVTGRGTGGRMEVYRLVSCFLYAGKFGIGTIIGLHLMTQISHRYEAMGPICTRRIHIDPLRPGDVPADADGRPPAQRDHDGSPYHPRGDSSDYAFALLFGMAGILLSNCLLLPKLSASITQNQFHRFFHRHLTFYVVYIWSKQHPQHRVDMFGIALSAAHLPFAYLVLGCAMSNGQAVPTDIVTGMFVGHVYFYLACVVPRVLGGRRALLSTPAALVDLCHWLEGRDLAGDAGAGRGNGGPRLADVDGVIGG